MSYPSSSTPPLPLNRLAIYSHRGWLSSQIFLSLQATRSLVKIFHRPGSDLSNIDRETLNAWGQRVKVVEVDLEREGRDDPAGLARKFEGVEVLMYVQYIDVS